MRAREQTEREDAREVQTFVRGFDGWFRSSSSKSDSKEDFDERQ